MTRGVNGYDLGQVRMDLYSDRILLDPNAIALNSDLMVNQAQTKGSVPHCFLGLSPLVVGLSFSSE